MWYKEQARVRILYPVRLDLSKNYFQQLDDEDKAAKEENLSIYQKIKLALEK